MFLLKKFCQISKKKNLALSLFLWAIAFSIRFHAHHMLNAVNWRPISQPIQLVDEQSFEASFIADQRMGFDVILSTDRSPQYDQQGCRLGMNVLDSYESCSEVPVELDVAWTIRSSEKILATGGYSSEVGGIGQSSVNGRVGAVLETFPAVESEQYDIFLQINNGDDFLNALNPRLDIKVMPMQYTETYKISKLYEYSANLFIGLGLIIGIVTLLQVFLKKKHS